MAGAGAARGQRGMARSRTVLVDVPIFGEAGFAPARRGAGGRPSPFPPVRSWRRAAARTGSSSPKLARTEAGTLALRGPMVPHHAFPARDRASGLPYFRIGRDGLVDTGYTCRVDSAAGAIVITGPPSGIVSVGGYRFPLQDLRETIARVDSRATLAALPDPIVGQRLIGNAGDRATMQAALDLVGVNPLIVAAFRDRSGVAAPIPLELTDRIDGALRALWHAGALH